MMTPFAFNRLNQRQRMLAGLNALGMAIPPTTGSVENKANYIAMPNQAVDVKQGGAVVGSTALQKANVLAPAGALKRAVTSTLTQPTTSSGIDARNTSATQLLTASADQLNLRRSTVKNPPTYSKLPGSNITPTVPNVAPNPVNNAYLDKQLATAKRALERQMAYQSKREREGAALVQDALDKAKESAGPTYEGQETRREETTRTGTASGDPARDPRTGSGAGYRPSDFYEPVQPLPDLTLLDAPPPLAAPKKFPTLEVVAGVGVFALVAYLFLK